MIAHVNGTALHYETVGEGRPILVMHGGLGWDHTYLCPWLDCLSDRAEVIYYDHRGNGQSARPASWDGVTHATWVADADALRAHLGHKRVVLLGHSYGGFLALEYAARHADHLDGLILCSTAPRLDYPEAIFEAVNRLGRPAAAAALEVALSGAPVEDDDAMGAGVAAIAPLYTLDPALAPSVIGGVRWSAEAFTHAFARCLPDYDARPDLAEIQVPTLVLAGRHDWFAPPAFGADRLHAELPDSEVVVFEHSVHLPFAEEPEAFASTVGAWLDRLP